MSSNFESGGQKEGNSAGIERVGNRDLENPSNQGGKMKPSLEQAIQSGILRDKLKRVGLIFAGLAMFGAKNAESASLNVENPYTRSVAEAPPDTETVPPSIPVPESGIPRDTEAFEVDNIYEKINEPLSEAERLLLRKKETFDLSDVEVGSFDPYNYEDLRRRSSEPMNPDSNVLEVDLNKEVINKLKNVLRARSEQVDLMLVHFATDTAFAKNKEIEIGNDIVMDRFKSALSEFIVGRKKYEEMVFTLAEAPMRIKESYDNDGLAKIQDLTIDRMVDEIRRFDDESNKKFNAKLNEFFTDFSNIYKDMSTNYIEALDQNSSAYDNMFSQLHLERSSKLHQIATESGSQQSFENSLSFISPEEKIQIMKDIGAVLPDIGSPYYGTEINKKMIDIIELAKKNGYSESSFVTAAHELNAMGVIFDRLVERHLILKENIQDIVTERGNQ